MTPMERGRPAEIRPRRRRQIALSLCLTLAILGHVSSVFAAGKTNSTPTIMHNKRSFRIPITIEPEDRRLLKEVQLWVSEDSGQHWKQTGVTAPDHPTFAYRASRDGEFWFAARTIDVKGQAFPGEGVEVEPSLKVVVDTVPPALTVQRDGRRGSFVSVRWEARDEHLDLSSLVVEYQVVGGRDWRQVPIRRRALIGSENWDAGTVDPLKVRASIGDKAGNVATFGLNVPEGIPTRESMPNNDAPEFSSTPPITKISSGSALPPPIDAPASLPGASDPPPFTFRPSNPSTAAAASPRAADAAPAVNEADIFGGPSSAPTAGGNTSAPVQPAGSEGGTILVGTPRFPLQYAVEDAGPNGPATVELWATPDGGRTWLRRGEDPDKTSPFMVDLGGEGTFGLRTVARAASGLGDQPPAPGDAPEVWVEVDSTAPQVQLSTPVAGTGANTGKVAIFWRASDLHLAAKPIQISWRPDQQGARWQAVTEPMENTGKFVWNVPMDVPPRFQIRVDAVDSVGNRGYAETPDSAPVVVDRAKPKSRIIGLDPNVRSGMGPGARSLR